MEQMSGVEKTRRIGSITFGTMLVVYGVLFLAHIFAKDMITQ